jgi:hypothetical protein
VLDLKINGLIDNPRWKGIACKCNHDNVETEYPIADCLHCKFQECEDSLPRENFTVNQIIVDKNGKDTGKTEKRVVQEITISRGDKYQDIIGWSF